MCNRFVSLFSLTLLISVIFFPSEIFAQVLVNEFSSNSNPEWVELFSSSDSILDLTGWSLSDASQAPASLSGSITPHGYFVFERSQGWLNNSGGDSITLRDNGGNIIDAITYGSSGSLVQGTPSEDKSAGRAPDGSTNWQNQLVWTKNSANPTPTTSPTPAPSIVPTSTPVIIPTTPPSTLQPTSTPTKTITPTKTKTPTPKLSPSKGLTPTEEDQEGVVLGIASTPTPSPEEQPKEGNSVLPIVISLSFIGAGLGLLSLLFVWKKRNALHFQEARGDDILKR